MIRNKLHWNFNQIVKKNILINAFQYVSCKMLTIIVTAPFSSDSRETGWFCQYAVYVFNSLKPSDAYVTSIGSDNGLSPGRHQAVIWTNAAKLSIVPLGKNFNENNRNLYIFIRENTFVNIVWKMTAILSQPQRVRMTYNTSFPLDNWCEIWHILPSTFVVINLFLTKIGLIKSLQTHLNSSNISYVQRLKPVFEH